VRGGENRHSALNHRELKLPRAAFFVPNESCISSVTTHDGVSSPVVRGLGKCHAEVRNYLCRAIELPQETFLHVNIPDRSQSIDSRRTMTSFSSWTKQQF
jgi:hypothetical protein